MHARFRRNSGCGCSTTRAFFVIALTLILWSHHARQPSR